MERRIGNALKTAFFTSERHPCCLPTRLRPPPPPPAGSQSLWNARSSAGARSPRSGSPRSAAPGYRHRIRASGDGTPSALPRDLQGPRDVHTVTVLRGICSSRSLAHGEREGASLWSPDQTRTGPPAHGAADTVHRDGPSPAPGPPLGQTHRPARRWLSVTVTSLFLTRTVPEADSNTRREVLVAAGDRPECGHTHNLHPEKSHKAPPPPQPAGSHPLNPLNPPEPRGPAAPGKFPFQ